MVMVVLVVAVADEGLSGETVDAETTYENIK